MRVCDDMNCSKRKICRVYEMIHQFKNEIRIDVSACAYYGQTLVPSNVSSVTNAVAPKVRSAEEINDISARIHALQGENKSISPETIKKAKAGHMQFSVDDHDIS